MQCLSCGQEDFKAISFNNEWGNRGVVQCRNCKLSQVDPLPSEEEVRKFYEEKYTLDYGRYHKHTFSDKFIAPFFMKMRIQARLAYLKERGITLPGKDVLEVGSARGRFLQALGEKGAWVYGKELSKERCQYTEIKKVLNESMDIVFCYHVLEHMVNPLKEFKEIRRMIKNRGYLIGEVPYSPQDIKLTGMMEKSVFDNTHLWHFNKESLYNILKKAGFKMIKINRIGLQSILKCANVHYLHSSYDVPLRTRIMAGLQGIELVIKSLCGKPIIDEDYTDEDFRGPNDWMVFCARR